MTKKQIHSWVHYLSEDSHIVISPANVRDINGIVSRLKIEIKRNLKVFTSFSGFFFKTFYDFIIHIDQRPSIPCTRFPNHPWTDGHKPFWSKSSTNKDIMKLISVGISILEILIHGSEFYMTRGGRGESPRPPLVI